MSLWSLDKQKVLIVDGLADMRAMMRTLLASLGAKDVFMAKNGCEAVQMIEAERFDIILCDYNLGDGQNGQQVLEEVRYRELLPYTTVFVMITAENSMNMVFDALEHAPDDFLFKPVTRSMLLARLRSASSKKTRLRPVLTAMDQRNWRSALRQCNRLLEAAPEGAGAIDLQQLKGNLLLELGEYDKAVAFFSELVAAKPTIWACLGWSKALLYSHQASQAVPVLGGIIEKNPHLMQAYDLLAEAHLQLNDKKQAHNILQQAIAISPKAAMRYRRLGQMAYEQRNYAAAESAFKSALRLSKGSCRRNHSDYTRLARTLIMKGDNLNAVRVIREMAAEFRRSPSAQVQGAMLEWAAQCKMGKGEVSRAGIDSAFQQFQAHPETLDSEVALFIAGFCLRQRLMDYCKALLRHTLRNQPDNKHVRQNIIKLFNKAGMGEEGEKWVEEEITALTETMLWGGQLAELGQHEESLLLLEQTATPLPENITMNLSAANRLILFMLRRGKSPELLEKTHFYLDRVRCTAENHPSYRRLRSHLNYLHHRTWEPKQGQPILLQQAHR
jgi:CheY-like chemotaxis protein